jgi:hypothetical protein
MTESICDRSWIGPRLTNDMKSNCQIQTGLFTKLCMYDVVVRQRDHGISMPCYLDRTFNDSVKSARSLLCSVVSSCLCVLQEYECAMRAKWDTYGGRLHICKRILGSTDIYEGSAKWNTNRYEPENPIGIDAITV